MFTDNVNTKFVSAANLPEFFSFVIPTPSFHRQVHLTAEHLEGQVRIYMQYGAKKLTVVTLKPEQKVKIVVNG